MALTHWAHTRRGAVAPPPCNQHDIARQASKGQPDLVDPRISDLLERKLVRLATVTMANRTARIVWAVMSLKPAFVGAIPTSGADAQ